MWFLQGQQESCPFQVLLPGQQQELRPLFSPGEQLYVTVLLEAVSHGNVAGDTRHGRETPVGAVAAGAASFFSSAGSWSGLVPSPA